MPFRRLRPAALALSLLLGLAACQTAAVVPAPPPPPPPVPEAAPLPPPSCPRYVFHEEGVTSWYGRSHHGRPTASGTLFDMNGLSAAHRRLALGTRIRVTNLSNDRRLEVTVNDRGPHVRGRILDLSLAAARRLGFEESGTATVRIELVEPC
ncbi:MAG: septal ring lytic transglycosylase RlpA family protein [Alphaproteobacteria bacterium]|nr:septal ring lytic transglycosylase RlpA family protein [Alphaproteobacteria bacterium]